MNQQLANAGVRLIYQSPNDGDLLPLHVTGGIPINRFLHDLIANFTSPPTDYRFSLVSSSRNSDSADSDDNPAVHVSNTSESIRVGFLKSLMLWMDKHRRRRVQIPGHEKPVYVWESVTQIPDYPSFSSGSSDDVALMEDPPAAPPIVNEPESPNASMHVHLNRYLFLLPDLNLMFCYYILFRILSWFESQSFNPLLVRLGDFSYHLHQLVSSKPVVDSQGIRLTESLSVGMNARYVDLLSFVMFLTYFLESP